MQPRRNKKRRLSVQHLETRKLFAADVGFGDMTYGPEVSAEIGSIRPGKVERPTFGPVGDTCPPCELENQAEANVTTEPTKVERPVVGPHLITFTFDKLFTEHIASSTGPGGDDI